MLSDSSKRDLLFVRLGVLFLHLVAPLCSIYAATLLRRAVLKPYNPPLTAFQWWCMAEGAFFVFFLWYRGRLQREAIHPPLRTKEQRRELFELIRSEIHDPEKFLSGWFRGAKSENIGRDDLKVFLNWAFWESRAETGHIEELESYIQEVERMVGRKFKDGNGTAKGMRLTTDPIDMQWRSLLWYFIIMLIDTLTHARMLRYGMKYYWTPTFTFAIMPPRPLAFLTASGRSPAKRLSYWVRPHTSKTRLPVLYIHGIGVGLHPNVEFLHELDLALNGRSKEKSDGQIGVLAVEILPISSRLTHSIFTREEFVAELTQVLDAHDFKRFVMVSHSYGSVLSTNVLTDDTLAARVSATLFIDPVTVLLHMPDVAYNFTIRQPRHANEWQLWYFASKDPGTAHTLGRHFFWSENVLWRQRIMHLVEKNGMRMTASLAAKDLIVDTTAVGQYLMKAKVSDPVLIEDVKEHREKMQLHDKKAEKESKDWKQEAWQGKDLEVIWWEGLDHAEVFDEKSTRKKLVDVLVEYSKGK